MAVVTVEEALQLWEKALDTQVYKVEMIDVKSAKGYVLAEDMYRPFQNQRWMGMPLPFPWIVMSILLTVL